jgi:hypothetical protein
MAYDQNSFLQGIAVGKSLKGWSSGLGTSVPKCWNDEGVYTYFYIDYHLPISAVSLTMFNLSTRVLCEYGELDVSAIESVNSTTFKVYCDISKATNGWIAVAGYNSSWLYYDSGYAVPEYSAVFWLDGRQTYAFGYIEDEGRLVGRSYNGEDDYTMYIHPGVKYEYAEEATLEKYSLSASDTCTISYS